MIYLDNAATTKPRSEVVDAMLPYLKDDYYNPSSIYTISQQLRDVVENSREIIASTIGAKKEELYFTSGGTESDNWAIKGVAKSYKRKGNHIITTKIEHHAVLHTCEALEKEGYEVTYLDVDKDGLIDLDELRAAIKDNTILVTIMFANNEIGTIQDVKSIGEITSEKNVLFHTDAVQAFGHLPIDVNELGIDLMSISSHKIYGPKGIGALYVKSGVRISSYVDGGAQERNRRGGTENVPAIIGFTKACQLAFKHLEKESKRQTELRDYAINRIEDEITFCKLNGHRTKRLPNNINFSFEFIEGESLLLMLDMKGVCASSGSACTSGSLDPSHVLLALGLPHEIAHGSLRLTLGEDTTKEEMDAVVDDLKVIVDRLRNMSPIYEDYLSGKQQSVIESMRGNKNV